ncbi:MAG TPA: hypothetical protein EYO34_07380, partial [Candidatus Marinimicrobia bacterium]|nr:hypothetical protein [Candidatus Neomarinimicrobiota bacterium]
MDAAGEQILTGAADLSLDGGVIVNAGTLSSSGGLVSAYNLSAGGTGVLNFQGGTLSLPDGATLVGGATFTTSGATLNLGRSLAVADTWTSTNTSISLTADTTLTSTALLTVKTVENVGKYSLTLGSDTTDLTISEGITINDPSGQDRSLGDTGDPIIIPTHDWSSQIVMSHVVGQLFEKMGYTVEYTPTDSQAVYEAVRMGNPHLELEVWESSFATSFNTALEQGGIHDAGTHAAGTREEWWYPAYVADLCPGLPDWEALAACSAQFARADSGGKGVFIDGPVGWEHDNSRIEALGMDFIVKHVDEASGLWAELESAAQANTPIVMFNWSPNFTDALYGGAFVEFPAFHEKGYLKKAAWDGMPTKWPAAYNTLTRINFTTNQIGAMALYVDSEGLGYPEAAAKWIEENESAWMPWLRDGFYSDDADLTFNGPVNVLTSGISSSGGTVTFGAGSNGTSFAEDTGMELTNTSLVLQTGLDLPYLQFSGTSNFQTNGNTLNLGVLEIGLESELDLTDVVTGSESKLFL